jgi:hypothetical protein
VQLVACELDGAGGVMLDVFIEGGVGDVVGKVANVIEVTEIFPFGPSGFVEGAGLVDEGADGGLASQERLEIFIHSAGNGGKSEYSRLVEAGDWTVMRLAARR